MKNIFWFAIIFTGWPTLMSHIAPQASAREPSSDVFSKVVKPLIATHCASCHGAEQQEANLKLHKLTGDLAQDSPTMWQAILEQFESGAMPPDDAPQPAAAARDAASAWIRAELASQQAALALVTRVYPDQGNRLEHRLLFGDAASHDAARAASSVRVWRVHSSIYQAAIERISRREMFAKRKNGDTSPTLSSPWGLIEQEGFRDYAALYRIDEPETDLLISNAQAAAHFMVNKQGKHGGESRLFQAYLATPDPNEAQRAAVVDEAFAQVLRRSPTADERERYARLLRESDDQFGRARGLSTTLSAVMLHSELVFRFELGDVDSQQARNRLAPRELAFAIAYAVTDAGPDAALFAAADRGDLTDAAGVRREALRLLNAPDIQKNVVLRFFQEYFDYAHAVEVFKDEETRAAAGLGYRHYLPEHFVEDTDDLVLYLFERDKNVLAELLTTDRSYVHHQKWHARTGSARDLPHPFSKKQQANLHYNIAPEEWTEDMPFALPAGQRSGVLTQPSWLIAHSTNFENNAIVRGKWVRERLLGGTIPDTPITVDAKLPEDADKTLRERMHVTREAFCWKCHAQMDSLGLTFEMYDHFGRHRESELNRPVDATGEITGSGDARLDGPVESAVQMLAKLAASQHVEQVFVRHAFRFWMGRNETLADAPALQAAHAAYREHGGSMKQLIAALVSSDTFVYRQPAK